MDVYAPTDRVLCFGPFRIDMVRRCLTRDAERVRLTPRLFELLVFLVRNAGRLVEKDELMQAVWGDRTVAEANLSQAVFSLRRVLREEGAGEEFIITVPGRGYRFAELVVPALVVLERDVPALSSPSTEMSPAPPRRAQRLAFTAAALGLFLLCLIAWRLGGGKHPFMPPPHSLAVLAFANMSGDPHQQYFSDGLSEELINDLARVETLQVAARASSFSFRGGTESPRQIGRRLNVGAVLDGSVRRDSGRVRIDAELVDTVSGYTLWAHSYDSEQANTLKLQQDIASAVVAALVPQLVGDTAARLTMGGTQNAAAFDAFLRGVTALRAGDEAGWDTARASFDQAIALDPGYAEAHAQRAKALEFIAGSGTISDPAAAKALMDQALAASATAIALAPMLADAHAARATVLEAMLDFAGADREIERAAELGPGNASVQLYYAQFATRMGHRAAGTAAVLRGVALDPLATHSYLSEGTVFYLDRRYADALEALQHLQTLTGHMTMLGTDMTGAIDLMSGKPAEARIVCGKATDWTQTLCLAVADHALGQQAKAQADFAALQGMLGTNGNFQYAEVYAQWGQPQAALAALDAAYRTHDPGLDELRVDPYLDPLRGNQHFAQLLRQMNFPP